MHAHCRGLHAHASQQGCLKLQLAQRRPGIFDASWLQVPAWGCLKFLLAQRRPGIFDLEGRRHGESIVLLSLCDLSVWLAECLLLERQGSVPADVPLSEMIYDRLVKDNMATKMLG